MSPRKENVSGKKEKPQMLLRDLPGHEGVGGRGKGSIECEAGHCDFTRSCFLSDLLGDRAPLD